jgi:uncharacterized protein
LIVVDANILVYAYQEQAPQRIAARMWLEEALSGIEPVRLPWRSIHTFLRLMSSGAIGQPQRVDVLIEIVDSWLAASNVAVVVPGPSYWPILRKLLLEKQVRSDLVNDAHIAALALENGATVCTADRDFRRFDGLKIINPLA